MWLHKKEVLCVINGLFLCSFSAYGALRMVSQEGQKPPSPKSGRSRSPHHTSSDLLGGRAKGVLSSSALSPSHSVDRVGCSVPGQARVFPPFWAPELGWLDPELVVEGVTLLSFRTRVVTRPERYKWSFCVFESSDKSANGPFAAEGQFVFWSLITTAHKLKWNCECVPETLKNNKN